MYHSVKQFEKRLNWTMAKFCCFCGSVMSDSSVTTGTAVHQALLSKGFPRQEYWSGLPFPSPGDLPNLGIKVAYPALKVNSLPLSHQGSPIQNLKNFIKDMYLSLSASELILVFELTSVQFSSVTQSCLNLCNPMNCSTPGFPGHHQLPNSHKLRYIKLVIPFSHPILCGPLLLLSPIPPSTRVFSNESTLCMRWPKYWSFSFSISPSKEHPGLTSFRMDWLDLLAVHGTLKSLLQHRSSKASILQCSAFFTVQPSPSIYDYWKNHSLD